MTELCTVADLAAFLQIAIADDNLAALQAVQDATAEIQSYCNQTLAAVAATPTRSTWASGRPGSSCRSCL